MTSYFCLGFYDSYRFMKYVFCHFVIIMFDILFLIFIILRNFMDG